MKITSDQLPLQQGLSSTLKPNKPEPSQELKSQLKQINSVEVQIEQLRQQDSSEFTRFTAFEGKHQVVILPESEKTDQMHAVLDKLSHEQGQNLIDLGVLEDEDFLALAQQLNDTELQQFASAALALQTAPDFNSFALNYSSGKQNVQDFIQTLSSLDSDTRSQVLAKADELSSKVPLSNDDSVYDSGGLITPSSPAANDIHNFITAINNIDTERLSEDANRILDNLEGADELQQSNLLQLFGGDLELSFRLLESVEGFESKTQDEVISFLAELSKTATQPDSLSLDPIRRPSSPDEWHGAVLNHADDTPSVVYGMIDTFVSLTEDYTFSDDQLKEMATDLKHLDSTHQRAYLEITSTGLNTLVGDDSKHDLATNDSMLSTLDNLRSDHNTRMLVAESYMGEKRISDGRAFYEIKDHSTAIQDQRQTIELLTTHAWLNQDAPAQTKQLANNLSQLEAEQRDDLIKQINHSGATISRLAEHDLTLLEADFEQFLNRTSAIIESKSVKDLVEFESALPEPVKDDFWQAASFVEDQVDTLVETLIPFTDDTKAFILESINSLKEATDQQELDIDIAKEQAKSLLDSFSELTQEQ
ncbi:hypothetical protein ACMXYR_07155 [Neptuniibacter sp. QD29_5]|uniref:hypothetical protein n=1 Tax=Neptuniibacter sp. QD29_5 TaxID=3398207 RepID=UPI0039F50F87